MLASTLRTGGYARLELERWVKEYGGRIPERGTMPEAERFIQMFNSLPLKEIPGQHYLWLFREPRSLTPGRSRFVEVCKHYGVAPRNGKKKKTYSLRNIAEIEVPTGIDWEAFQQRRARERQAQEEESRRLREQMRSVTMVNPFAQEPRLTPETTRWAYNQMVDPAATTQFQWYVRPQTEPAQPTRAPEIVPEADPSFWEREEP